ETRGTVALRMPDHAFTLELLNETGPLAVSSANLTGEAAAVRIDEARDMLGESVSVYLDAGLMTTGVPSTIVDATTLVTPADERRVRVLRDGAVTRERLRDVLGELLERDDEEGDPSE